MDRRIVLARLAVHAGVQVKRVPPLPEQSQGCTHVLNQAPQYIDIGIGAQRMGISRAAFRLRLLRNNVPGVRKFGGDYVYDPVQFHAWLDVNG